MPGSDGLQGMRRPQIHYLMVVILIAGLLFGTCVLPYWFAPTEFAIGASFEVGFNNGISYAAYLVLVALLVLVVARLFPKPEHGLRQRSIEGLRLFNQWLFAGVTLFHVTLFAAIYAYKGRFVFGESLYFQQLLYRMTQGEVPYIDFSFYYGPMMLYPAFWLAGLFGLNAGYAIWFVTNYVVGLWFLHIVLGICVTNKRHRALWFVFLAFGLFNPLTGVNVTMTRYLFPSLVFLTVTRYLRLGGWRHGFVAVLSLAAAITYSFEVAALSLLAALLIWLVHILKPQTCLALGSFLGRVVREQLPELPCEDGLTTYQNVARRGVGLIIMAGAICAAFFLLVDPSGRALRDYPEIALSYSGGAHGVPIYPNLPFIALSTLTIVGLAGLVRVILRDSDQRDSLLLLVYALVAVASQRAAFGPAEPSHFAYYGLPVFLITLFVVYRFSQRRRIFTSLVGVLLVGIMLPMQYYHFTEFLPFVARRLVPATHADISADLTVPSGATLEQGLREVVSVLGADRSYLMYGMSYNSLPVYRDLGLRYPTYFTMLTNARNEQGIRRAIDEVRDQKTIVIMRKQDLHGFERPLPPGEFWRALNILSGAHTRGSDLAGLLLKSKNRLMAPFLDFVQAEYVPVYDQGLLIAFGPR